MSKKIKNIKAILSKKYDNYDENDIRSFSIKCDEVSDLGYNLYKYSKILKEQLEILNNDNKTGFSFQKLYSSLKEFNYYSDRITELNTDEIVNFISEIIEDLKKIIRNKKRKKEEESEIEENISPEIDQEEVEEENADNTKEDQLTEEDIGQV